MVQDLTTGCHSELDSESIWIPGQARDDNNLTFCFEFAIFN